MQGLEENQGVLLGIYCVQWADMALSHEECARFSQIYKKHAKLHKMAAFSLSRDPAEVSGPAEKAGRWQYLGSQNLPQMAYS